MELRILGFFELYPGRAFRRRDIAEMLNLRGGERKQLTGILRKMVENGIVEQRKGAYRLAQQRESVVGVFIQTWQGYGFLRLDNENQEDLFVPAKCIATAMDGDRVQVRRRFSSRDGRPYGEIVGVLERAHKKILGSYRQLARGGEVRPLDAKLGRGIRVGRQDEVNPGDIVEVEIERFASGTSSSSGRIVAVLGAPDDPQVDIETVIRSHALPHQFSSEVLAEAATLDAEIAADEIARRRDLRELPLLTIDGETAQDFDDAVALRKEADGTYRLWVCIADVAHYVTEDSALDVAARERGTSVYFPGYCLPMLPEALSHGICSLNPQEDRLVMTAELLFNPAGERLTSAFYPAVMRSRARLTYAEVAACLDQTGKQHLSVEIIRQLQEMSALAESFGSMRKERGSLDLDVPEVDIVLDEAGRPIDLVKTERTKAHRLIEEFMLAANEAVATFLEQHNRSFLYRIHEPPALDKLQDFQQLAAECGVGSVLGKNLQHDLQNLLTEMIDRPEARLLNQQLLRSLQQARYAPENKGHFGLAAPCYCHFTSPIRRYPDLSVHRTLKKALSVTRSKKRVPDAALFELAVDCSAKERRAMTAERDLVALRRCQFMEKHLGEQFPGIISAVTEFGFFVELENIFVEGLVHVRSLTGDYFTFDPTTRTLIGERRRQTYRVGMPVRIKVLKVESGRRRLDFTLVEQR
ncbi:MAG: ribonuclease R [Desulfuromonadales bacterium C00003093]|nr:MAG: ribonuclease R [Desulfuromonadales bacterium C00003093]